MSVDHLRRDLRYAVRSLLRQRGFTVAALVTLALGIGANSTVFSVVDALLFRPLPVERPEELVAIFTSDFSGPTFGTSSLRDYQDFAGNDVFSTLFAFRSALPIALRHDAGTERRQVTVVTGNYFEALGVRPVAGRVLLRDDDRPGAARVVVLSYGIWQELFGGSASAIGQTLTLNANPFTIVGVVPATFTGARVDQSPDLWIPTASASLSNTFYTSRRSRGLWVMGRLRPGTTIEQARAAVDVTASRLHREFPEDWSDATKARRRVTVLREPDTRFRNALGEQNYMTLTRAATLMVAVVMALLLVACANLANLLLARASTRRREIGVRLALGAGQAAVMRQWLLESVVLAVLGAAAGLAVAWPLLDLLERTAQTLPIVQTLDLSIDVRVVAFTSALTLLTALTFGLAPAIHASRADIVHALRRDGGQWLSRRWRGVRGVLVVFQLASSIVMLSLGGVFLRSLVNAESTDLGFAGTNVALLSLQLPQQMPAAAAAVVQQRIVDDVRSLPGVESAAFARSIPLSADVASSDVSVDGHIAAPGEDMEVAFNTVGVGYFDTMGIGVTRGRALAAEDSRPGAPSTLVVNERFADRFWPGQNPIGRFVRVGDETPAEVVGVAQDAKYASLDEAPTPFVYLPWRPGAAPGTLHVRGAGDAGALLPAIRRRITAIDPTLVVFDVTTIEQHLDAALSPIRLASSTLGLFAIIGLTLAVVGLYSVTAYAVAMRTREIGIRMALGATRGSVGRLVTLESARLVGVGAGAGLIGAFLATRALQALVYGTQVTQWSVAGTSALLLIASAAAATYVTARRAVRIEPTVALRSE